jgi:nitrite reductase (NADH) small subunit
MVRCMNEIVIGELRDFPEGCYRVLRVEDFEFGIFREGGRLVAYENRCPHDGGPVCQGKVIPRVEEELAPDQTSRGLRFSSRRNIVCPWHGWEFDIATGRHCGDPRYRLRPVNVRVHENHVYVTVPAVA